jgi:hypothetical protein
LMARRQETIKRASRAERVGFVAVELAGLHDESVEFVEELGIAGELGFKERANLFVGAARMSLDFGREEIVAFEDTARVGVDNED